MNANLLVEKVLRVMRFKKAVKHLKGDYVLDVGCDNMAFEKWVGAERSYKGIERDYSGITHNTYSTIVMLAMIEHLPPSELHGKLNMLRYCLKDGGRFVITTPTPIAKTPLDIMANLGLLEKEGIREHHHYYNKKELFELARFHSLKVIHYSKFQLGMNQILVLEK